MIITASIIAIAIFGILGTIIFIVKTGINDFKQDSNKPIG
jgi:type II secretory pathway pseudopilin PulG